MNKIARIIFLFSPFFFYSQIKTKGGGFSIATSIIAQYDISKGRYTHVDVAYKGSIGTNLYRSSSNLNFYRL
jgi:hypothetical protein